MCFKIILSFTFLISTTFAYTESEFLNDFKSPYKKPIGRKILLYGTGATLLVTATKPLLEYPLQDYMSENHPMGFVANIGDLSGQMLPNISYIAYQWFQEESGKQRAKLMFKASLFAGGTTFFLKRLFNQRRPSGNDRNSFPSGHTTTAFAFSSVVAREHPEYALYAHGLATIVGLSRINDNAHFLHDVLMGATIGMAYGYSIDKVDQTNMSILPLQNDGFIVNYTLKM